MATDHVTETIDVVLVGVDDLAEGEKRTFEAGDFEVLVCRVRGELFAVDNTCSHQEARLCEGRLVGYRITCPKHSAQFDVRDGSHKNPPAYRGIARFDLVSGAAGTAVRVPARKVEAPGFDTGPMIRSR